MGIIHDIPTTLFKYQRGCKYSVTRAMCKMNDSKFCFPILLDTLKRKRNYTYAYGREVKKICHNINIMGKTMIIIIVIYLFCQRR